MLYHTTFHRFRYIHSPCLFVILKSQVVSLQTAHSWANAGVLLGDACIGSRVVFEAIKLLG